MDPVWAKRVLFGEETLRSSALYNLIFIQLWLLPPCKLVSRAVEKNKLDHLWVLTWAAKRRSMGVRAATFEGEDAEEAESLAR